MTTSIFDKTDKGRDEIATRQYRLVPRLRTLLVLVDGKQTKGELLQKFSGIGLNEDSLAELLDNGFIRQTVAAAPQVVAVAPAPAAEKTVPDPDSFLPPGQNQFQAIYQFYTETIKSTIGLRGYGLQLKVEKAASIDEFRALRQPYLEAVLRAKGNEMTRSLGGRLDQLLYLGGVVPPNTTIIGLAAATE